MIESLVYSINTISGGRIYSYLDTVDFAEKNIENIIETYIYIIFIVFRIMFVFP